MLFSWLFLHLAGSWINFKGGVVIIKSVKWVPNEVHFVAIQDVGEVKVKDSVLIVWFKTWLWCCSGLADVNKVHNRAFLVHSCLVTSLSFIQIIVAMQKLTHQLCNQSENFHHFLQLIWNPWESVLEHQKDFKCDKKYDFQGLCDDLSHNNLF